MDSALQEKIGNLPQSPGCYLMKDSEGVIIYVGKAVNLRARVRSYFTRADTRAFVQRLDEWLSDIDVIITANEKEALLLENELIKKHKPRFNVMLRDDKNFISLRLDVKQAYPRLEVVRRVRKDGARYFGPYSSASSIRETLRVVNRYFQLRTCSDSVMNNRRRPCLQYQIKRCPAPCVFDVPVDQYRRSVDDVTLFLEGRADELTGHLRDRMKSAAKDLRFEEAAMLRDQITAIDRSLEKQRMVVADHIDQDVLGLYREGPHLVMQVLFVRQGKLLGGRHYPFKGQELPDSDVLRQFVAQYYDGGAFVPHEVLLPSAIEEAGSLEDWLTEKRGGRVHLLVPKRGDKLKLVGMARENAEHNFRDWRRNNAGTEELLVRLMGRLRLSRLPRRIECFDNSHLQGSLSVGSKVAFTDGEPDKARYRHYKVRTAAGNDDFQMMFEVLSRRLSRGREENDLPDLIVIDGGKGQLNVAREVLREQGLEGRIDLVALAEGRVVNDEKLFAARQGFSPDEARSEPSSTTSESPVDGGDSTPSAPDSTAPRRVIGRRRGGKSRTAGRWKHDEVERSPERVFLPGQKNPIVLRANSAELFLLQRLRDEAHRFANMFQRKLRRSANFRSVLREIPGVGEVRQKALLRHFGSLRRVREASVEELAEVENVNRKTAEEIWRFFHSDDRNGVDGNAQEEAEELAFADAGLEEMDDPDADEENARVLDEVAEEIGESRLGNQREASATSTSTEKAGE